MNFQLALLFSFIYFSHLATFCFAVSVQFNNLFCLIDFLFDVKYSSKTMVKKRYLKTLLQQDTFKRYLANYLSFPIFKMYHTFLTCF